MRLCVTARFSKVFGVVLTLGMAGALCLRLTPAARAGEFVSPREASRAVVLRNLETTSRGAVTGVIANQSPTTVEDVRLLIRHTWFWKDEKHPGEKSPGRAEYYTVAGEITPGGEQPFSYSPNPPLPQRADGHFETSVEIVSFGQTDP